MVSSKKKFNKGLIVLNKGERISVICLLALIVILLGFSVFRPMIDWPRKESLAFHKLDSLLSIPKAIREVAVENSPEDTGKKQKPEPTSRSSPSEPTSRSSPSLKKSGNKESLVQPSASPKRVAITPLDINLADSSELIALPQIGEVMASRIHRYRNRLGGFVSMEQLFEVKGMDTSRFETIKPYIFLESNDLMKININQDDFKTLLRHPYLEYEQVKAIVNYRERKGLVKDWEQLKGIVGEVNPLLAYYVSF